MENLEQGIRETVVRTTQRYPCQCVHHSLSTLPIRNSDRSAKVYGNAEGIRLPDMEGIFPMDEDSKPVHGLLCEGGQLHSPTLRAPDRRLTWCNGVV